MKKLFIPVVLLILACTDDEGKPCIYKPALTTEEVTNISESFATLNGAIINTSENCETPNNIEQGFVYSTEIQPTLDNIQVNVNGTTISTTIENLEPNTTYYVRTFLINSFGEFYGNEINFNTNAIVPEAPSITNVTAGNERVDVTFDAPADDGGSTITEYTATSNPGNISSTISQAEGGTLTVSGLTNCTSYTFTVTATNGVGTSEPSDASNEVTPYSYAEGTVHCGSSPTEVVNVTNPATGKTWMDRNLGASQAATSSTDADAYGDLYQWGRGADGHQCRDSQTTSTLSSTDQPGHGDFITYWGSPFDWRSPQNDNLWQGINGVNNPCPCGYRLPTGAELEAERQSWSSNDAAGAFSSPLKLPTAGTRNPASGGSIDGAGTAGYYWSSTAYNSESQFLNFYSIDANLVRESRSFGLSVRCIKD